MVKEALETKPLLSLENVRPQDPLYQEWIKRENEIDSRIRSTMATSKPGIMWVYKERKGSRWVKVDTHERDFIKMYHDTWWDHENRDLKAAIDQFVKPADTVSVLLSGHDAVLPSLALGRIGERGKLYVVTPGPYLEEGLGQALFRLFVDYDYIKGDDGSLKTEEELVEEELLQKLTGSALVSINLRGAASNFLAHPFTTDIDFYRDGLDWEQRGLMSAFYERFHISPLRYFAPSFPDKIMPGSLDAVIEADRLSEISEEQKEAVLYAIDQVLKPGGHLVIRENARQQTQIEYYGQDLLARNYQRLQPNKTSKIRSAQIMVFRKNEDESLTFQSAEVSITNQEQIEDGICAIQHVWDLQRTPDNRVRFENELASALIHALTRKHEIDGEVINGRSIDVSLKEELTLRWFRKMSLLPPLVTEFGGDINRAVDFILAHFKPRQTTGQIQQIQAAISEIAGQEVTDKRDPTGKNSYTVDDLSKELGISKSAVRKAIGKNLGVKPLGAATGYAGKSGFSKRAVESRQLQLSYQEYLVIRDALRGQTTKKG